MTAWISCKQTSCCNFRSARGFYLKLTLTLAIKRLDYCFTWTSSLLWWSVPLWQSCVLRDFSHSEWLPIRVVQMVANWEYRSICCWSKIFPHRILAEKFCTGCTEFSHKESTTFCNTPLIKNYTRPSHTFLNLFEANKFTQFTNEQQNCGTSL